MTKTLKLSWLRFSFCIAIFGIFPALLVASNIKAGHVGSSTVAIFLLYVSLVSFFSLGWARLRKANALQPILVTETDRILQLLIGPIVSAGIWFASTILLMIALAVTSALLGYAA
jgi:hypothetical protein